MLFRVPVGACYFEVVVCENITYYDQNISGDNKNINVIFKKNYFQSLKEQLINDQKKSFTFSHVEVLDGYIWTHFDYKYFVDFYDENYGFCTEECVEDFVMLTKITKIDKNIKKSTAELIDIYAEYMSGSTLRFYSELIYKILFNTFSYVKNLERLTENITRKVSNLTEFAAVIKSSKIDKNIKKTLYSENINYKTIIRYKKYSDEYLNLFEY